MVMPSFRQTTISCLNTTPELTTERYKVAFSSLDNGIAKLLWRERLCYDISESIARVHVLEILHKVNDPKQSLLNLHRLHFPLLHMKCVVEDERPFFMAFQNPRLYI